MSASKRKGPRKIYLIGSLRNPRLPSLGDRMRSWGHAVFDNWHGAGPEADRHWQQYEQDRGWTYVEALRQPLAEHNFAFDARWLAWADTGVLLYPAGKSAHLELGWMAGQGQETFILLDKEPEEWDLMLKFATAVFMDEGSLMEALER